MVIYVCYIRLEFCSTVSHWSISLINRIFAFFSKQQKVSKNINIQVYTSGTVLKIPIALSSYPATFTKKYVYLKSKHFPGLENGFVAHKTNQMPFLYKQKLVENIEKNK